MRINMSTPLMSEANKFSGNYTIYNDKDVALYSGESNNIGRRLSEHRRNIKNGHLDLAEHFNDNWYAIITNVGGDPASRLIEECKIHTETSTLFSVAGRASDGFVGEENRNSPLTNQDVLSIRALHAKGDITYSALGKKFGITGTSVSKIVRRASWAHI